MYLNLFGFLKPKFHNLIHYPRILLENGPCIHFSSMRFEAFHRQIKLNALSSNNRINLLKTVAIKQTLYNCQILHSLEFRDLINIESFDENDLEYENLDLQTENKSIAKVDVNGIFYKIGSVLVTDIADSEK